LRHLLTFRQKFIQAAEDTLRKVFHEHMKASKEKETKASDVLFVGIHCRGHEFKSMEVQAGYKPIKADYFVKAMDLYRTHFIDKHVVFLLISDNMQWIRDNLVPLLENSGNLYLGSKGDGEEEDR